MNLIKSLRCWFLVKVWLAISAVFDVSVAAEGTLSVVHPNFCADVQQLMTGTQLTPINVTHGDWESFVVSKAKIRPLETEQFVLYDEETHKQPVRVSCKMKTSDHLIDEYGGNAAHEGGRCSSINARIVDNVLSGMTLEEIERQQLTQERIVFDKDDVVVSGLRWTEPYAFVYLAEDGMVHIHSKRMQINWKNLLFALAPERFRGALYCHLIAPEYARLLLLGDTVAPAQNLTAKD